MSKETFQELREREALIEKWYKESKDGWFWNYEGLDYCRHGYKIIEKRPDQPWSSARVVVRPPTRHNGGPTPERKLHKESSRVKKLAKGGEFEPFKWHKGMNPAQCEKCDEPFKDGESVIHWNLPNGRQDICGECYLDLQQDRSLIQLAKKMDEQ